MLLSTRPRRSRRPVRRKAGRRGVDALVISAAFCSAFLSSCTIRPELRGQRMLAPHAQSFGAVAAARWDTLERPVSASGGEEARIVSAIGARLVAAAGEEPDAWRFDVLDLGGAGGLVALPGGRVGIDQSHLAGLSEGGVRGDAVADAIAMALAHAIAHSKLNHVGERYAEAAKRVAALTPPEGVAGSGAMAHAGGATSYSLASGLAPGTDSTRGPTLAAASPQLDAVAVDRALAIPFASVDAGDPPVPFSPIHEQEADRRAMRLLERAGFSISNAAAVWSVFSAHSPGVAIWHPVTQARLDDLRREAALLEAMPQ